jgi:hypothetical protein
MTRSDRAAGVLVDAAHKAANRANSEESNEFRKKPIR